MSVLSSPELRPIAQAAMNDAITSLGGISALLVTEEGSSLLISRFRIFFASRVVQAVTVDRDITAPMAKDAFIEAQQDTWSPKINELYTMMINFLAVARMSATAEQACWDRVREMVKESDKQTSEK